MRSQVKRRPRVGLVTKLLAGSGFLPVWIMTGVLVVVAAVVAPEALSSSSFSVTLPLAAFLAVAALGEMLVVMTGGIDLSIPGTLTFAAYLVVGVSGGGNGGLAGAILLAFLYAALIGLVNGVLIGVARLNPLIVTLAIGQIVLGITTSYAGGIAHESAVPSDLSNWATHRFVGISWMFWVGVLIALVLAWLLRSTIVGRRFQAVGANPRAAWISGIHVRTYVVFAYVAASVFYAMAGVLLAAFIRSPSLDLGDPYLLGPIAAVVIGGASLAGGSASPTSTLAAAFALTLLNQVLRVLGLSTALQYVIFGVAIMAGMVISGERIVGAVGALLQRPSVRARIYAIGSEDDTTDGGQEGMAQASG
jgi:ribose transport system permease protein